MLSSGDFGLDGKPSRGRKMSLHDQELRADMQPKTELPRYTLTEKGSNWHGEKDAELDTPWSTDE